MANGILIGIDLGTTVLKVCAFDRKTGAALALVSRRLPVRADPSGAREQDTDLVDRAFRSACAELRKTPGFVRAAVQGIGLAAQAGSTIIADRATGDALTPMILWNDSRARPHDADLAAEAPPAYWRRRTLRDVPPAGLGRLRMLKRMHPELFDANNIHVGAGEYLFHKMTGVWRQDAGHALQVGSYNAAHQRPDAALFARGGVPLSFVAPLRQGHAAEPLSKDGARLLGLEPGVPVAGPYFDQEAGFLSAVGVSDRPLLCSLGTAWVGTFVSPPGMTGRSPVQLVIPSPLERDVPLRRTLRSPSGPGRLVVLPLLTGNVGWDWALAKFAAQDHRKALEEARRAFAQSLLPRPGLTAVPWFTMFNPLDRGLAGGATFVGVGPHTDRGDLLRAVATGMAFEMARVFRHAHQRGVFDCVVLGGGAAGASYFRELLAALFAPQPVLWQHEEGSSAARGALHAFDERTLRSPASQAPARPVARSRVADRVLDAYEFYLRVFDKLYGAIPEARPFTSSKKGEKV